MSFQVSRTSRMAACVIAAFSLPVDRPRPNRLPEIVVTSPPKIARSSTGTTASGDNLQGTLPVVTDRFATVTVVPNEELRRNGAATLTTFYSRSPAYRIEFCAGRIRAGRSSVASMSNRVRIQEDGVERERGARTWVKITSFRSIP